MPVDVVFVGDPRADMDADAQVQLALWCNVDICVHRCFLHRERDADRRVDSRELEHQSVTQALDETAFLSWQQLMNDVIDERAPALDGAGFVFLHQAHGLDHIDDEHGAHDARGTGL